MSLIDSERAFHKRCDELHEGLFEKLKGQNIGSFSTLAFSLGSPQNQVGETELTQLADSVFETQSTLGTTAVLRRLHFESRTLLMAEMKTQSERADASQPIRKLPLWRSRVDLMRKERNCQAFLTHLSSSRRTHSLTLCTTLLKVATLCTCIPASVTPGKMRCKRNPKANQKP